MLGLPTPATWSLTKGEGFTGFPKLNADISASVSSDHEVPLATGPLHMLFFLFLEISVMLSVPNSLLFIFKSTDKLFIYLFFLREASLEFSELIKHS